MNKLKATFFIISLFLLQNYFWFYHSWGEVPVKFRYIVYIGLMSAILAIGRLILQELPDSWPIKVWTYFYLFSIFLVLATGTFYMFFGQSLFWNNVISHYRYYVCTPIPFIALILLSKVARKSP